MITHNMRRIGELQTPQFPCQFTPEEDDEKHAYYIIRTCCTNCGENCFKPQSYFNTSDLSLFRKNSRYQESHALVFDLLLLIFSGLVCAGVLVSMEYLLPAIRAKKLIKNLAEETETVIAHCEADDVREEVNRVKEIVERDNHDNALDAVENHALVAYNLHLKFGKLDAIKKGLSFAVSRGECFGLLGSNAAGKTSTFRLLTGDISPSAGNMYSGELNYYKHRISYLSSIGYCPQFDAIIGQLTGLQMVKLYGALRGIPPERLDEDAKVWLDKFGLLGSANKKCGEYSGGMKRRLSTTMALIGSPIVVLLDEPTTGVDPVFRRQFWNVIREIRANGQSVVLTSHTMDECEELCSRLAIMANGQFKCLDSIQNLKQEFGRGYVLSVRLQKGVGEEEESEHGGKVNLLLQKIVEEFTPCKLHCQQSYLIEYQLLNMPLWYSDIFRTMEQIRNLAEIGSLVEEYSVTAASLEDVFLALVGQAQGN